MPRDHDILTTLRTLDPADPHADADGVRARSDFTRIIATAPVERVPEHGRLASGTAPVRPRTRTRPVRRALVVGSVVAALATAAVALPSVTGGDAAFASWTPTPATLSDEARHAAAEQCRDAQQDGPGEGYETELRTADPAVVESRGAWTAVVLATGDGFSALCITDDSTRLFTDWFGSIGTLSDDLAAGPRKLVATDLGTGTIDAGRLSVAAGVAGSDVAEVSYHSPEHGIVNATVHDGRFALWLPGDDLAYAARDGVEVEVTYRDGTTLTRRLHL